MSASMGGFGYQNGGSAGGVVATNIKVVNVTADATLGSGDSGNLYTNDGAAGQVILTLPPAVAIPVSGEALVFGFSVVTAQNLRIQVGNAADQIREGALQSIVNGYIESAVPGAIIWMVNTKANEWQCFGWSVPYAVLTS